MTHVINLYGGPGTGKSTTAAHLFALLKHAGVNCEMALEYAKDKVWEGSHGVFSNQMYIFGKQHHRIHRLLGKVDVVITDSPLLLSLHYGINMPTQFRDLVVYTYKQMKNIDIFLTRVKPYQEAGRFQKEHEAKKMDGQIAELLIEYGSDDGYHTIVADETAAFEIKKIYDNIKKYFSD